MEPTTSALTHEADEDVLDVFRTACCVVGGESFDACTRIRVIEFCLISAESPSTDKYPSGRHFQHD